MASRAVAQSRSPGNSLARCCERRVKMRLIGRWQRTCGNGRCSGLRVQQRIIFSRQPAEDSHQIGVLVAGEGHDAGRSGNCSSEAGCGRRIGDIAINSIILAPSWPAAKQSFERNRSASNPRRLSFAKTRSRGCRARVAQAIFVNQIRGLAVHRQDQPASNECIRPGWCCWSG